MLGVLCFLVCFRLFWFVFLVSPKQRLVSHNTFAAYARPPSKYASVHLVFYPAVRKQFDVRSSIHRSCP